MAESVRCSKDRFESWARPVGSRTGMRREPGRLGLRAGGMADVVPQESEKASRRHKTVGEAVVVEQPGRQAQLWCRLRRQLQSCSIGETKAAFRPLVRGKVDRVNMLPEQRLRDEVWLGSSEVEVRPKRVGSFSTAPGCAM